jgi:hypothetical protein
MRGLSEKTTELISVARQLLAEFHPMTLRQLHYAERGLIRTAKEETGGRPSTQYWTL